MYFKGSKFLINIVSILLIVASASMLSCSANYKLFVDFDKYKNECKLFVEDTETGELVYDGVKIFLADLINFLDEWEAWQEYDERLESMKVNVVSSECIGKIKKFLEEEEKALKDSMRHMRKYRVTMVEETEEPKTEEAVVENTKGLKDLEEDEFIEVKKKKNIKRKKTIKKIKDNRNNKDRKKDINCNKK